MTRSEAISYVVTILLAAICGVQLMVVSYQREQIRQVQLTTYEGVATSPAPTIMCVNDIITVYNRAAEDTLGYNREEVLGKPTITLVPSKYTAAHKKAYSRIKKFATHYQRHSYLILPFKLKSGEEQKLPTIVSSVKDSNNNLLSILRVTDIDNEITWMDVETGKRYKYRNITAE